MCICIHTPYSVCILCCSISFFFFFFNHHIGMVISNGLLFPSVSNEDLKRRGRHTVLNKIKHHIISVPLVMDVGNAINLLFSYVIY